MSTAAAAPTAPVPPRSGEQQLAWEAHWRPRAALTALLAGLLTIAGGVYGQVIFADYPSVGLLRALSPALSGRAEPSVDPHRAVAVFYGRHGAQFVGATIITALGLLATAAVLVYLYEATRGRRPQTPRVAQWCAIVAPAVVAVLTVARQVAVNHNSSTYLQHPGGHRYALDVINGGVVLGLSYVILIAQIAIVVAFVMISLNAMRVGLLTRFLGVLGMFAGVLFLIGIVPPWLIGGLWLVMLAPLFALRWPGGQPPAWLSGQAEPWPSQQAVREQRMAARNRAEARMIQASPSASERAEAEAAGDVPGGTEPVAPARVPANRRKRRKR